MEPRRAGPRDVLPDASRYQLLVKIAAGGMATVYVGRSNAKHGVSRLFAIKRAHVHLADDAVFRRMFVAEAQLAARIHHPNVVAVQDVEELDEELLLVMDYVEGAALVSMRPLAPDVRGRARLATRILLDACAGLHAAHELADERGKPLGIVHRDVSPQNILVGLDGITRIADFGIAKSTGGAAPSTITGALKGKVGYMAPEYVTSGTVDRRLDVFAMGVVLWECLTGVRLYRTTSEAELVAAVAACRIEPPTAIEGTIPKALEAIVLRALEKDPEARFATVRDFADALEAAARAEDLLGSHREVAAAVEEVAGADLERRRAIVADRIAPGEATSEPAIDLGPEPTHTRTLDPPLSDRTADGGGTLSVPPREAKPKARSRAVEGIVALVAIGAIAGVGIGMARKSAGSGEAPHLAPPSSVVPPSSSGAEKASTAVPAAMPNASATTAPAATGSATAVGAPSSSATPRTTPRDPRAQAASARPRSSIDAPTTAGTAAPASTSHGDPEPVAPAASAPATPGRAPPNPYRRDGTP